MYRYKDEAVGTVVDWHVPAKFAGRGYEVLNPLGEVIKVVPRQLSDSELNDKDLVERLKRGAEAELARLAEWDRFLLLRYSTIEDIDAARDRDRFLQLQDVVALWRSLSRDRALRDN